MKINEKIAIIILTCNGEKTVGDLLESIKNQTKECFLLVIDSESNDSTMDILSKCNMSIKIEKICREKFNHGATRRRAVDICRNADYFVFLTQDAILAENNSIEKIIKCFDDEEIGCAYGRQLPHRNAGILGAHARIFNYPNQSRIKSIKDIKELGIKTAFISDSFSAYRKKALLDVGGFPKKVALSEDMYVAAKMILRGWKVFYCAEAKVYHSHDYTIIKEFRRYLDIGRFHAEESWIQDIFGKTEKEGRKFILSEISYVYRKKKYSYIHKIIWNSIAKYLGYILGKYERKILNKF